jgi:hypothetical protein
MSKSEEMFENIAETIGVDELSAEIVDGKFVISPAEAGVMLFSFLQIADEEAKQRHADRAHLETELEMMRDDNSNLRDLLERCYAVLLDNDYNELADEVIKAAYPVYGVREDGSYERLDG